MKNSIHYTVKKIDHDAWKNILSQFEDASIYQTEEFTKASVGGNNIEQFILKENDTVIAAALVRLKIIKKLNRGIAYIRWAPLWQRKNSERNPMIFELAIKNLIEEYVNKRKLMLRIMSGLSEEDNQDIIIILKKLGLTPFKNKSKSILMDLSKTEDELKAGLNKRWRYSLRNAEKRDLTIRMSNSNEAFKQFLNIYKEMHARKNFKEYVDVESFGKINDELPDNLKLNIFLCENENKVISGIVVPTIGNTAIYLLGATKEIALRMKSSFKVQWEIIKWLKVNGYKYYDLGGIDKVENPGVYNFKSRMGGKEITYIGGYQISNSFLSSKIVQLGELIKKH